MPQRLNTALFGCKVEIFEHDQEGSWEGIITGAVWEMDQPQYWVEIASGEKFLLPVTGVRLLRLVQGRPGRKLPLKQTQKKARILKLVDS